MNSAAAPSSLRARSRPVGAIVWFWTSTIAVNVSTVVVLAVLSHSTLEGGLAAVSAVLGLSLIAAIAPGALQLRAATDVAAGCPRLARRGGSSARSASPWWRRRR